MQFTVSSKALCAVVANVGRVISPKNAIASLNNFLFSLEGETLTITGSDIDNSLSGNITVTNPWGEGKFLVDARRLTSLLKELAEQPITFHINEDNMEIAVESASGRYLMIGVTAEQYPTFKKQEDAEGETKEFLCGGETILKGIDSTAFAVGTDDFHAPMMGIFFDIKEDGITFVATDTRKLVKFSTSQVQPGIVASCILHPKCANIIKSIVSKDDTLTIEIAANIGILSTESYKFIFSFIKGRFPDYNRVIPQNNPYAMTINRKELINALRRVNVFVDPGMNLVKARLTNDSIELKSADPSMQTQGNEKLSCQYDAEEMIIGLSSAYLIEIHNIIRSDEVVWHLADQSRPVEI